MAAADGTSPHASRIASQVWSAWPAMHPQRSSTPTSSNLPTLFVGAGGNATAFESKIKEAGYGNCTLRSDGNVADVWSWMAQTQRVSNPLKVVFKPVDPAHDRAYWLRIPPTEGLTSVISAECDRASNTIKVTAPGVAQVTLMFNGALVDFTKKVNIEINGKSRSQSVVPTVEEMLQLSSSSDNGRVYVARRVYDVLYMAPGPALGRDPPTPPSPQMVHARSAVPFLTIAGVAGAATMAVELAAVRLLAPWFGASSHVWTGT